MTEADEAAPPVGRQVTFGHSDAVPPRAPHADLKSKDLGSVFCISGIFSAYPIFGLLRQRLTNATISNIFLTHFIGGRKLHNFVRFK